MSTDQQAPPLLPTPRRLEMRPGSCRLGAEQATAAARPEAVDAAALLGPQRLAVRHETAPHLQHPDGYELEVQEDGACIRAMSHAGFVHCVQTLRQLLAWAEAMEAVPCLFVADEPAFSWRGLHVDVARHWFPLADLERLVDAMALHKFNRLHWHLTDDQGWRLEIQAWPRLTEVGSRRRESPRRGARTEGDGTPYGGMYTQADVRHFVAYAEARGITIVPEIELPGHAQAAIAAYPTLGHAPAPEVWTRWGISKRIFNVHEETLHFLDDVLAEVADLFPGPYVHLGGDEVPIDEWQEDGDAQVRMQELGLPDERALQGWFLRRMAATLTEHGKRPVGWDEILEAGAPRETVVMAWRDAAHARTAARAGHDVVLCPMTHCYFDHYQGPEETEPEAIGGHTDWQQVLSLAPYDDSWAADERTRVLGVQGNLWSEYIPDGAHLDYLAWPRASALAEVAWVGPGPHDPARFRAQWRTVARLLHARGVAFREMA